MDKDFIDMLRKEGAILTLLGYSVYSLNHLYVILFYDRVGHYIFIQSAKSVQDAMNKIVRHGGVVRELNEDEIIEKGMVVTK
jgi:hypothetical protein